MMRHFYADLSELFDQNNTILCLIHVYLVFHFDLQLLLPIRIKY